MENEFITWVKSLPAGSVVLIILGGILTLCAFIAAIFGLVKTIQSVIKFCKKCKSEKLEKILEEKEFKKSVLTTLESMSELKCEYEIQHVEFEEALNNIKKSISVINDNSNSKYNEILTHMNGIDSNVDKIDTSLNEIRRETKILTKSNKDNIKAYITDKCNIAERDGYIDVFVLSNCEAMYEDYLAEKGDSFIEGKMVKLRMLPNLPPVKNSEDN